MTILVLEYVFWATGTLLYGTLSLFILTTRLYRRSPLFSLWIVEMFVSSLILSFVIRYASPEIYSKTYWVLTYIELALQIGTVTEFARGCLEGNTERTTGPERYLLLGLLCAIVLSGVLSSSAKPATTEILDIFYVRVKLFTSLVTFFATFVVLFVTERFGSVWHDIEFRRFLGFVGFACSSALTDSFHTYWRTAPSFVDLEFFRLLFSQVILVYWTLLLSRPSQNISPSDAANLAHLRHIYTAR